MASIEITPADLSNAGDRVNAKSGEIESQISELKTLIGSVSSFWRGSAHDHFQEVYNEWEVAINKMNDALRQISTNMKKAAVNYENAEQANTFS